MRHKLSNINTEKRTATCSVCGQVDIVGRIIKENKWRCGVENRARDLRSSKWLPFTFTPSDYNLLYNQQNCECAICHKKVTDRKLSVDHDHKTGLLRGLLCTKCNWALGLFCDSAENLRSAVEYLEKQHLKKTG